MREITRIQAALRPHLPWHGARLTSVALFLCLLRKHNLNYASDRTVSTDLVSRQ